MRDLVEGCYSKGYPGFPQFCMNPCTLQNMDTNSFYSLAIHFVMHIRLGVVQPSISLLVDQQVWEVYL